MTPEELKEKAKKQLIEAAKKKFGKIYPCQKFGTFQKSFTYADDMIIFWFNTIDESTHIVTHSSHTHAISNLELD